MMKHNIKTIIAFLLLFAMVAVVFTGCDEASSKTEEGTSQSTATATPIPTVLTKDEAKTLFTKALADIFAAKSITFSVNSNQSRKVVNGESENEITLSEKMSGSFMTDSEGKVKAHLNSERKQNDSVDTTEGYFLNGKLYSKGDTVSVDRYTNSISIDTIMNRYFSFTDSYDTLIKGVFDERIADCVTINGRTVSVSINDIVKFAETLCGSSVSESELEEMKQAVTRFSFTFSCTLGDDGNISSIGYNLQMDAAQDGATANQIMTLSVEFSQVNQVEDKGIPTWLDEYLKDPENFADRIGHDENGNIEWYEVDTTKDGSVVKTVRYNADGSVDFYREYTYDDIIRVLTNIVYSADGTEKEKYVCKYEDDENGESVSFTESYYENGELKTVKVTNYVDESLSGTTYYENGVAVRKECWSGDTEYYYYKPDGELFCYKVEGRWGGDKYFDAEGNELTVNEYYELTYMVEEYDDKGRCIKKTEYNVEKQVQGIITLSYDANGKLASEAKTDKNSNKLWEKTYYANGSIKEDIEYPENGFITKKVKSYSEDDKFLSETVYENNGEYVVYHYNGKDQYIKIERFGANGKLSYSADYDEKGRISKEYIYNTEGSLESYNIREYYSEINCIVTRYDANGNELGKYDTGNFGSGG